MYCLSMSVFNYWNNFGDFGTSPLMGTISTVQYFTAITQKSQSKVTEGHQDDGVEVPQRMHTTKYFVCTVCT